MPLDPTTVQRRVDEAGDHLLFVAAHLDEATCRLDEARGAFSAAQGASPEFAAIEEALEVLNARVQALHDGVGAYPRQIEAESN